MVDDDAIHLDALSKRLARRGFSVEVASCGHDALAKINQARIDRAGYDLVLLDQLRPGMTSLGLLKLLRASHSPRDLPVIVVSDPDQSESVADALVEGANDYLTKPVDVQVMAQRIEAQLVRTRAERDRQRGDPLTGLKSRSEFMKDLAASLAGQDPLALVLLDLDGFKALNDGFGYMAGDKVLGEVAVRLRLAAFQQGAITARMGSDEFALLLPGVASRDDAVQRVQLVFACLDPAVDLCGENVAISVALGLTLTAARRQSASELLREADLAMQRAKEIGKNRWELYDPSLRERAQTRAAVSNDLRQALAKNQMAVFYQPKIHLLTRAVVGFEALLRWRHPRRGLLGPAEFVPAAEESGLIVPIGDWVLREACQQLKEWQHRFPMDPMLSMNVNLSVKQLGDPLLVARVESILSETGVDPEHLKLELTESSLITEIEAARDVLVSLQALRIGLNLDDFGTGYSSLSYLRNLHFDTLKIDRSFIQKLATDQESQAIVETIMTLARALNMSVVAEGIEHEAQVDRLLDLGCETGQGFLFSKPVSAAAAAALLPGPCVPAPAIVS